MSSGLRNLLVRIGADMSQMQSEMKRAQSSLESFKGGVKSALAGVTAAFATIGGATYIKDAVNESMKMEAAVQQVSRIMGSSANDFMAWSQTTAAAFNLSKSQAVQYGSIYGNLISGFSKDSAQTTKMTEDLLQSVAVVASKSGFTIEDSLRRVRSGLLGNTEAIEDLGINVNVAMLQSTNAFKQFANGKSWDKLDFQTQQLIRYYGILEQANVKYGDSIGMNSLSATAAFTMQLNNLKLAIGDAFKPIWVAVIPALTTMVIWLTTAANTVAQFFQVLFGKEPTSGADAVAKSANNAAGAVGGVGDAYKDAGGAAKKAAKEQKGFLAGFDEVNTVQTNKDSADASGGAGGSGSGIDTSAMKGFEDVGNSATQVAQKIRDAANAVKGFFSSIGSFISDHKAIILAALAGIGAGFIAYTVIMNQAIWVNKAFSVVCPILEKGLKGIGTAFTFLTSPIGIVVAVIAALTAAFVYFYMTNDTFKGLVNGIFSKIGDVLKWVWTDIMVPLGSYIASAFVSAWDSLSDAASWLWKNVMIPLGDFLKQIWNNVLVPLGKVIGEYLAMAFDTLAKVAESFWKNVMVPLGDYLKSIFIGVIETLKVVFMSLWNNVMKPFGDFIQNKFGVTWSDFGELIMWVWNDILKPLASFLMGAFFYAFDTVFKNIGTIIGGFKATFIGLMTFIQGVFTADWAKAWEGIKQIFWGVWGTFAEVAKKPINAIITMINYLISAMNKIKIDIPDWVPGIGGKNFGISIPQIPALAKGGITNGPTLALIGDNPGGKEVVSPLDKLTDIVAGAVANGMMAAGQFSGNSNKASGDVIINLDGTRLARVLNPYSQKENNRIGTTMIKTT